MGDGPDFIVDPSGQAKDVRRGSSNGRSGYRPAGRSAGSEARQHAGPTARPYARRASLTTDQPRQDRSSGVILIPIGLIITVIIVIFRACAGETEVPQQQAFTFRREAPLPLNLGDPDLDRGHRFLARGEYAEAMASYNEALQRNPLLAEAHNGCGLVYLAMGEHEGAISEFDQAIQLDAGMADGYNNRGISYMELGQYEEALADLDEAVRVDKDFAKAYYNRGLVYYAQGELDQAIYDYGRAIALSSRRRNPVTPEVTSIPGLALEGEAAQKYRQLFSKEANVPVAYASRALAYYDKGEAQKARADLDKALELGLDTGEEEWLGQLLEWLLELEEMEREPESRPSL